ncbi:transposable element Tcb2 transposase [Trichonephila clavipes]|nr:transposable element Tcb2 transposase [Trichonephila clavipes]
MSFARRPGSGCPQKISHWENRHIIRNAHVQRLAEGHLGSWHPLRVLPLTLTHRRLLLEWCCTRENCTAAEWNQVVFSNESRFNPSSNDNHDRVWRPRGDRLNPAFA